MRSTPNWQAVIQTQSLKNADLELPENVTLISHVPQLKVLEKADIAITHAGCSSFKECAFTGTPMIAVPWNNDGYGNSARVVEHELGVCLDASNISSSILKEALVYVTSNERIQFSVREMQRKLLSQESCEQGVNYINNILTKNER